MKCNYLINGDSFRTPEARLAVSSAKGSIGRMSDIERSSQKKHDRFFEISKTLYLDKNSA